MRLKLIACETFTREFCLAIANSPHTIDPEFTTINKHADSSDLRHHLQKAINKAAHTNIRYAAILLGYGLCGNATVGLVAPHIPLIIPRAHDCATLLLGSQEAYEQHFGNTPCQPFSSAGFWERSPENIHNSIDILDKLRDTYGEDNAQFLYNTLYSCPTPPVFIAHQELQALSHAQNFKDKLAAKGEPGQILPGQLTIIRKLVNGDWDDATFLTVAPHQRTVGIYDKKEVIRALY